MFGTLIAGSFSMMPFATLLLMFSFFVLVVIKRLDSRGLKIFGYVVAVLLWISIVITVVGGGIKNMARSIRMSPQAQQMSGVSRYPMLLGGVTQARPRTQLPRKMAVPQVAQEQTQDQAKLSTQTKQSNVAATQNK